MRHVSGDLGSAVSGRPGRAGRASPALGGAGLQAPGLTRARAGARESGGGSTAVAARAPRRYPIGATEPPGTGRPAANSRWTARRAGTMRLPSSSRLHAARAPDAPAGRAPAAQGIARPRVSLSPTLTKSRLKAAPESPDSRPPVFGTGSRGPISTLGESKKRCGTGRIGADWACIIGDVVVNLTQLVSPQGGPRRAHLLGSGGGRSRSSIRQGGPADARPPRP